MRRTIKETHQHLLRENPLLYAACLLGIIASVALGVFGHERWALALFIVAGLVGLQLLRYKAS